MQRSVKEKNTHIEKRHISPKDSFLNRNALFQPLHTSVSKTRDLLQIIKPQETRKRTNPIKIEMINDQEFRFYNKQMILQNIFHGDELNKQQETPIDSNQLKREYIKKSLKHATALCVSVEEIAPVFEGASNREFNRKIN